MLAFDQPIEQIIRKRFSCRRYLREPLSMEHYRSLSDDTASLETGPLGTRLRFALAAATDQDRKMLNGLGTYGFIKHPTGFLIGAATGEPKTLEDFGYGMELLVLRATDLGLGTCWVGGIFTRSAFAQKIGLLDGEKLPAVIATGYPEPDAVERDRTRKLAASDTRLGWDRLFLNGDGKKILSEGEAGPYALPLEMVRLGPSASNKQPWRILRQGSDYHFFLERTPGYAGANPAVRFLAGIQDIQRIDLGIAMCHFELAARAGGLDGQWACERTGDYPEAPSAWEYTATWMGK